MTGVQTCALPIFVYDGTGNWLDAFEKYFDADVFLVSGSEKKPVSDAALIFACSVDGVAFDSCQAGQFIEPGTYTLRVSVEEDTERFYLVFPTPLSSAVEDLRAHVRSRVEHLTGLSVGKIDIKISWLRPSSHVRKSLK